MSARRSASRSRASRPAAATSRAATWWGRAWVRAVEEAAYADADLHAGAGALAQRRASAAITVDRGPSWRPVDDRADVWSVGAHRARCSTRSAGGAFVEVVAAESGHLAALLAGELPHRLVEHVRGGRRRAAALRR